MSGSDRYRDHSNAAACGVVIGLVVAGVVSWSLFALAVIGIL